MTWIVRGSFRADSLVFLWLPQVKVFGHASDSFCRKTAARATGIPIRFPEVGL